MRCLAGVLAAVLASSALPALAADPTVAWYRFEDGKLGDVVAGNTPVTDSGPNQLTGWTPYGCHAGRVAGIAPGSRLAWDVAGLDDWFLVPDDPRLATGGSLTLEAWVKVRAYQPRAVTNFILFRGDGTPGWDAYCLALSPAGDLVFHIEGPGLRAGDPPPTIQCPFKWFGVTVHLAGVFDARTGSLSLYVDGDLVASATTAARPRVRLNPAMGPGLGVGGYHGGPRTSFAMDGILDDVRLSSAALRPADLLCGSLPVLEWVGTGGFEADGVDPDRGPTPGSFLFAVRCATPDGATLPVRLELRHQGQCLEPIAMSRARGAATGDNSIYRARVELGAGKWEYRVVADVAKGVPLCWRPGPVVAAAGTD
jgi:hypothetical protein